MESLKNLNFIKFVNILVAIFLLRNSWNHLCYYFLEKCLPSVLQSPIVLCLDIFIRSLLLLFCTHFWRNRCPYAYSGIKAEICLEVIFLLFWSEKQKNFCCFSENIFEELLSITPARTHSIIGLKSWVLKLTYFT